jgi:hypothetical protein
VPEDHATPHATRRALLQSLGAAAAATSLPAAAARLDLDLARPADNLTAWMKLRASTETRDVYFWFTGTLDIAVPGEPIRPLVALESLLLRRAEKKGEHLYHVTDWEATIYRHPETGEVAEQIDNPFINRRVRPLHYREGPVPFEYTAVRQPRLLGMETPFATKDGPFNYPWKIVSGDLWMTKAFYIFGRPQWLDIREFPLETPATPLNVASVTTLKARLEEVRDPARPAVATEMFYQATSDWLPWMLMGQTPGFVVWHEAGKKLFSLDEAPPDTLKALQKIHPEWFRRPVPWEEFTNMFTMYKRLRK